MRLKSGQMSYIENLRLRKIGMKLTSWKWVIRKVTRVSNCVDGLLSRGGSGSGSGSDSGSDRGVGR